MSPEAPSDTRPRVLLNLPHATFSLILSHEAEESLQSAVHLIGGGPITNSDSLLSLAPEADILVTGWGSIPITSGDFDHFRNLKLVIHTGGSLRYTFEDLKFPQGVTICTAASENARSVAEYTLGLILASLRGAFQWSERLRVEGFSKWSELHANEAKGYTDRTIALVGFGEIAKRLIGLLRRFDFRILVVSSFVQPEDEQSLGIRQVTLEDAAREADVLSLHEADLPEFRQMIDAHILSLMRDRAILINTARGALVDEAALETALQTRPMLALLDVLAEEENEKMLADHPLLKLPNCFLTPHVAGSLGGEVKRFGNYLVREIQNFRQTRPFENALPHATLHRRA